MMFAAMFAAVGSKTKEPHPGDAALSFWGGE